MRLESNRKSLQSLKRGMSGAYLWRWTHTSPTELHTQRYAVQFPKRLYQLLKGGRGGVDERNLLVFSNPYGFFIGHGFVENDDAWFEAADTHNHHGQSIQFQRW